jgi:hypothetical protein
MILFINQYIEQLVNVIPRYISITMFSPVNNFKICLENCKGSLHQESLIEIKCEMQIWVTYVMWIFNFKNL